ncbi:hypothetical protein HDU79_009948, partial [Rhizoclosmatium sp. JEL0117]
NLAIKEGTFVAPEHPSAERQQEIIKKAALDKQRKKARYSRNRQTRTLAQLKERKEQFGRFAYEKLSPEEKARGMGFPLRNEEFRNLANMDMADVLRKEICSAYEMELNDANMDGKTGARIAKFNAIIDDKKSQIKVTISDKIKSIQSGKTAIVQLYNNACATSFAAFPVLHELYLRQDFLQMMVYRGQQRALKVFMGYIHGNLDPKLVTCVFGSAEFSQQMKGTVSGCGGRLLKEMKKRFRWINVDEFKSTMNPGCCWGTGFKGGKIDLGPCSCDFEVEQELAKLTEELLAGKDLNELLTQRDDGTFLHLAQIEALLKSLGADESFSVDETEQFDNSKFFTQKDADHHGEGEEENGRYGDDKGEFGEDGEDLRESLTTVEEGDGVEEEDDSDPMDLEESETAPVSVTVESKSLAVESDIMEDVLEEGELATSGDTSTSMEVEEELWSAALDTLLQSLSAPASTDGLDPEGIYAIHVTHPSEIWKREGVGDVYPEDVRRIPLTNSVARAKSKTILKHSKAFRPGWKEHLPLVERVKLAFHAGVPVGSPLRGLKYCHHCARPGSGAGLGPNQVPNGPTKAPVVDPNFAIKEGTFVAPEHPSAERQQEIIKKAALDKQRKKARYSHNRQTRTLAQLKERKEQFGRFAYEKLSPEEKARGMGFPLRNEEFRNLANMDMAEVLRKEICSAYEIELNGVNMDSKTEARIAKFNAIIDDKKSQIKATISDKIKSIQSGKTTIVQQYNNACATSFAAFPVLHELYLRQDFLQMMVYRGQQRALKVFMGYIHGNLDPKLVTCVFGSAEFSQQMKGTVSGCGGQLLKEMKKRFRWINVDEFKSTMNPGCCWGTGFKGGKIDLGPCSCDFEVEQELAKLTEELLAGKDLNELLTQRDDGTFLHLAQIEALLKSLGADESFSVDETEQFDNSKFFTQKDADHHGEGEEENGRYGDDKGEFGEDGEDLRESLTTVEEGDGVEEEDDSDPMDLEESETAPVSVTVESKSLAVESDIMEDVLEEGELATSGDTSTSMEVEEELWSAALDTLLQSLSAPASTDGLDPEGIYAIHVTHPSEIWKREGVGDVYPEDVRRIPLTNSVARAKSKTILKHSKAFRPGWKEHLPLVERVKLAFHAGVPVGSPLRGLKYCHHCGTMWDRDRNAARNIWMCFWYMRLNGLKRPFTMQRKKSV